MTIKFIDEMVGDSFGLWISALFSSVVSRNPDLSFSQQKDVFFSVIEYLLTIGKIKFIAPGADCYISPDNPYPTFSIGDESAHWKADVGQILSYLKGKWPEGVMSENDEVLTIYFYEMPGIIWVDEDGRFFAS